MTTTTLKNIFHKVQSRKPFNDEDYEVVSDMIRLELERQEKLETVRLEITKSNQSKTRIFETGEALGLYIEKKGIEKLNERQEKNA
jgi:hypothetical protein